MSVEQFIARYCGLTESYWFYNNTIELVYNPKAHLYHRVEGSNLIPLDGVTTVCHIIDKSEVLVPWACKMMALKLLVEAPIITRTDGSRWLRVTSYEDFEALVLSAKTAHKDKLEDAGAVGHEAHAWIEEYIKVCIANGGVREAPGKAFPVEERAANCCRAALGWMERHNVRWLCTERKIYSAAYEYAGTMDGLCELDSCNDPNCCPEPFKDRLAVADWKTSNYLYIEYLLQTAAYMQAYNEEQFYVHGLPGAEMAEDRWVIRLGKDDGEFQAWHAPADTFQQDFDAFHLALQLKRSYAAVKERVKDQEEQLRKLEKAKQQAAKEAALKIKCPKADKFKGMRKPRCNGGEPCETCLKKYEERQAQKRVKLTQTVPGGVQT